MVLMLHSTYVYCCMLKCYTVRGWGLIVIWGFNRV